MTTMTLNGKTFEVDDEIASIVHALNAAGIPTVASCSGHGMRPGRISLADGRELFVLPSYEIGQWFETQFPRDINGQTKEERAAQPPSARLNVGDRVIPTICDTTKRDVRIRKIETVYRLSVDGFGLEAPYHEHELKPYTAETKTARNEACLGDGVPCASDGAGGCVACDDGKGNYRPAVETSLPHLDTCDLKNGGKSCTCGLL